MPQKIHIIDPLLKKKKNDLYCNHCNITKKKKRKKMREGEMNKKEVSHCKEFKQKVVLIRSFSLPHHTVCDTKSLCGKYS